jgi:MoaA/NifB/PqqE/SkfB family radical SAM enzyme
MTKDQVRGYSWGWLRHILPHKKDRDQASQSERWPVLQIETTSRCSMRCVFCPNKALGQEWLHGDLPWQVYRDHIGPHLAHFDLVYLQGWGEPLLHPHLWDMVRQAKSAGCRVGFTTCGGLLDEEKGQRLLDEGINILSISFAGASKSTHESLRVGSDFLKLATNVERLSKQRANFQNSSLKLELFFLMMRPNIHELPAFVRLAASLGADEVAATNVAYAPTPEIESRGVFAATPDPEYQAIVAESEQEAGRLGLQLRVYPLTMDDNILECDAKPTEMAFINHLGAVTPCVYLGLPVKDSAPRFFQGKNYPVSPVSFGNVRAGLIEALQGQSRATFVAPFRARKAFAYSALAFSAASGMGQDMRLPDPPPPCRHCYKLYGV